MGKKTIVEEHQKRMPPILTNKGQKPFLIGDYPTWLDFYFFEIVQLLKFLTAGEIMKEHPELSSYETRMKGLKGLKEYLADPNCHDAKLIFNNKVAKINGIQGFHGV